MNLAMHAHGAGELWGDVFGESAALVVVENFLKVVHAGEVVSGADTVSVAFELDHFEHILGAVRTGFRHQHAGDCQGVFVKGPAIHGVEVHDGGFDVVVHFEAVVCVRRAGERTSDANRAVPDGQVAPILTFSFGDDGLEF